MITRNFSFIEGSLDMEENSVKSIHLENDTIASTFTKYTFQDSTNSI